MRKIFVAIALFALTTLQAQTPTVTPTSVTEIPQPTMSTPQYGYVSYNAILVQMPEYAKAQENLAKLKATYDKETERAEKEFQQKFTDFLQGQKDFPATILQKRQMELKELMETSIAFKTKVRGLLKEAEKDLRKEVSKRLDKAIQDVAIEQKLAFVLNTDYHACPFLNPQQCIDITPAILAKLQLVVTQP